jgi:hypothetical protein
MNGLGATADAVRVRRLFVNPLHLSVADIQLSKVLFKNDFFL